ncbi:KH domain protein [Candidatus Gugararchaeum adminiculabundum]|nr:KH domain protein [Candidatus Gugararchaeum adminiculabundum]
MVKIGNDELKCIASFEELTGAAVEDCMLEENSFTFLVRKGDLGKAIGKGGQTIQRVRQQFGKNIRVVENAEEIEKFAANLFAPVNVFEVKVQEKDGKKHVTVVVNEKDRGPAIGRDGEKVKMARAMLERRFGAELKLASRSER